MYAQFSPFPTMSNKNRDKVTVSKTTVSTADEDELPFSIDSNSNSLNKSSSSVHASTKDACCSQKQVIISSATSIATGSVNKISTGESYVQDEDEVITTAVDDRSISSSSNSTSNNGTSTTDNYSSRNSVNINQQQRSDDEYGLQLQKTTEYSSLARESKVRDNIKNNYNDNDGDHYHDEIDENDDGFQTPTSLDHKIPEIRPCPPPPRKSPMVLFASSTTSYNAGSSSSSTRRCSKRKLSEDGGTSGRISRGRLLLDLSEEVESMFPSIVKDNFGRKIRKASSA